MFGFKVIVLNHHTQVRLAHSGKLGFESQFYHLPVQWPEQAACNIPKPHALHSENEANCAERTVDRIEGVNSELFALFLEPGGTF